jgi:hypothetical protein
VDIRPQASEVTKLWRPAVQHSTAVSSALQTSCWLFLPSEPTPGVVLTAAAEGLPQANARNRTEVGIAQRSKNAEPISQRHVLETRGAAG